MTFIIYSMYNKDLIRLHACLLSERELLVAKTSCRIQICLSDVFISL